MNIKKLADIALPAASGGAENRTTKYAVRVTNDTKALIFRFSCEAGAHSALCAFVLDYFGDDEARFPAVIEPRNEGLRVLGDQDVLYAAAAKRMIHVGRTATYMPVCVNIESEEGDNPTAVTTLFRVAKAKNCLDGLCQSISASLRCTVKDLFWGDGLIENDAGLIDAMILFEDPHFTIAGTPTMLTLRAFVEWLPNKQRKRMREETDPAELDRKKREWTAEKHKHKSKK